jgi:hypothetical protein
LWVQHNRRTTVAAPGLAAAATAPRSALYIIAIVRMRRHETARAYVERRTAEGLSKREIIRCLKRYIAREIYAPTPDEHLTI